MPKMKSVDSSMVAAISYARPARELYVRFHNGRTYVYEDVPPALFKELQAATSAGRFMQANIIDCFAAWRV